MSYRYDRPEEYEILRLVRILGGTSKVKGLLDVLKDRDITVDELLAYLKSLEYKIPSPIEAKIEELERRVLVLEGKPLPTQIQQPQPPTPQPKESRARSQYVRKGFTGKMPSAFVFNNKRYAINSWKQLLLTISNEMVKLHTKDFDRVLSLRGRKRPYFTKNAGELRVPEEINGTGVFVETNLSSNAIVRLSRDVLQLFGYNEALKIESN